MQKLISKNPIQRYKQGKQIVKAAGGTAAPTVVGTARRHDYKRGEVEYSVDKKSGRPIARYKSGPDTRWYYIAEGSTGYDREGNQNRFIGGRWLSKIGRDTSGTYVYVDRNTGNIYQRGLIDPTYKNVGKTLSYLGWGGNGQFNGKDYIYSDLKKTSTVTPAKVSTSTNDPNTPSDKETAGKSNMVVSNTKVATPVNDNHYIATRGNVNRYKNIVSQLGLTNRDAVRKFQMEKLGLTGDAADGIWGRDTQKAYDNYINNASNESVNWVNNAVNNYTTGIKNVNNVSTANAAQIMPSITSLTNPSVKIPNTVSVGDAFTKAFTNKLYNNTKIFKNGGLVSNNLIKRFKQGGIQKFQNAGNLPTAPKAKDRYAEGKRQSAITKGGRYGGRDKIEIKQVVGKKPGIFGSSPIIRQMVLHSTVSPSYNDTTYLEIPERKNPLVERKLRGIEKHPSVFKTYYSNVYPFFGDILPDLGSGTKEEYETLKRRFNTAWNLAK